MSRSTTRTRVALCALAALAVLAAGLAAPPRMPFPAALRATPAEAQPAPGCPTNPSAPLPSNSTRRLSVGPGGAQGNAKSYEPAISGDGRAVAYTSMASTLVGGDTNGAADVFLSESVSGATSRVSVDPNGAQGRLGSYAPSMSADGQKVAFYSEAPNLAGGDPDTAVAFGAHNGQLLLPYNTIGASTSVTFEAWFNTTSGGPILGTHDNVSPSAPTQWIPAVYVDTAGKLRGFFHGGGAQLVSAGAVNDGRWHHVVLTAAGTVQLLWLDNTLVGYTYGTINHLDMRWATVGQAFGSLWPGLPAGWTAFNGRIDEVAVYAKYLAPERVAAHFGARTNGYATAVANDAPKNWWRMNERPGAPPYPNTNYWPAYNAWGTGSGLYYSGAGFGYNGALTVDANDFTDIYVRDRGLLGTGAGATTRLVSIGLGGAPANSNSVWPAFSPDGRYVAFLSAASNLVPGDTNNSFDTFVADLTTGTIERASVATGGAQGNGHSYLGMFSADGHYMVFYSDANNLVPGDTNGATDSFLRDRWSGTTTRISVDSTGAQGSGVSVLPDISADGRYVTFYSVAPNLVPGDTNANMDVFLRDLGTATTTKISSGPAGAGANGASFYSRISGDGRTVTYNTQATNVVPGDANGAATDSVAWDRLTGVTTLLSGGPNGTTVPPTDGESFFPKPSFDGSKVAIDTSGALVGNDTNGIRDTYFVDRNLGVGTGLGALFDAVQVRAESDQAGLEQFYPYRQTSLGTGQAYVNLANGNLVAQFEDQVVPAQGLNLVVRHTYNSQRAGGLLGLFGADSGMGAGWNLSVADLDTGLDVGGSLGDAVGAVASLDVGAALRSVTAVVGGVNGQVLDFTDTDGTAHRFVRRGGPCSRWESPPGVNLKVTEEYSGSSLVAYRLVRPDGVVYRATPHGLEWRVTSVTDRRGNTLTYSYGLGGLATRLLKVTHNRFPDAPLATFTYDVLGRLTGIVTLPNYSAPDPATGQNRSWERTTHLEYEGLLPGVLTKVTQPDGQITRFDYPRLLGVPVSGLLESVTDGNGRKTAFTHDQSGPSPKVTEIRDRDQKPWGYSYAAGPGGTTVATATTPLGAPTTYTISPRATSNPAPGPEQDLRPAGANIVAITDAGNDSGAVTSRYEWSKNRLVATSTDGVDNRRTTSYNDLGLVTKVTEPKPNDPARTDLPAGAPKEVIENRLDYHFPPQFRYPLTGTTPERCERPAEVDPPPPVSNEGWCFAVAELTRTTFGSNQGEAARVTDFASDTTNGSLTSVTQRGNANGSPGEQDRTTTFGYYTYGGLKTVDGPRTDVADVVTYGDTTDPSYGRYDRNGSPRQILDALGKTKALEYTPYGLPARVEDRDGQETRSTYDEQDKLVQSVDPRGDTSKYAYDGNKQRITETSPANKVTRTEYNNTGSVTKVSGPGPVIAQTSYNADGTKATTTSPVLGVTEYEYWPNQALRSMEAPTSAGQAKALTEYSYDSANRLRRILSPITTDGGHRPEQTATYTPSGAIATQSKTSPLDNQQAVTRFAYNAHGEQIETKGPRNADGADAKLVQAYDAFGAVTSSDKYLSATESIRSSMGYDKAGNQTSTTQPSGAAGTAEDLTTHYRFDALNQLAAQLDDPVNSGHSVDYAYSGEGQQLSRIDKVNGAAARTTTFAFNPDNTRRSQVSIDHGAGTYLATCNWVGAEPSTGYDPDGNLLDTRTVTGTWTAGMTDLAACGGTTQRTLSMGYDDRNFMTSASQTVRSPHTGADVTRAQSFAWTNDAQWDAATHDGRLTDYVYDPSGSGRRTTITDWRNRATSATYQPSGAPRTQSVGGVVDQSIGYLPDGSMASLAWNRSSDNASVRSHTAMDYDVGGLRLGETVSVMQPPGSSASTGGPATFSYDLLDRLKSWKTPFDSGTTAYSLDEGGNITKEVGGPAGTVDSDYETGRLKTRNGVTFSYNGLGEETSRTDSSARTYDPAGHTASEKDPDKPKVDYVHDSTDRLIARTEGATTDPKNTTLYFYWGSGGAVAEETDGAGATKVRYLVDEDQEAVAQESYATAGVGTPDWAWLLVDEVGNVATLVDDAGVVKEVKAFDPYGKKDDKGSAIKEPAPGEPPAKPATLGFQGHITDPTTASVVLGARLYDPTAARFTTPDTFVAGALDLQLGTDALTGNRYLFAAANPVAFFDDGHWPSMPKFVKNVAKKALPAMAFVPVVGTAVEAVSVATGRDWLDGGRKMSGQERTLRGGLLVADIAVTVATAGAGSAATGAARKAAVKGLGAVTDKTAEATAKQGAKNLAKEGAEKAARLADPSEIPGYSSFSAAKRDLGPAGQGKVYDHIVEQSQVKRSGFRLDEINHPFNMNPTLAKFNQSRANYYSSKRPYTGGKTVRGWLTGQSFSAQYKFGMEILGKIERGKALP